jgi:hypothetical protein
LQPEVSVELDPEVAEFQCTQYERSALVSGRTMRFRQAPPDSCGAPVFALVLTNCLSEPVLVRVARFEDPAGRGETAYAFVEPHIQPRTLWRFAPLVATRRVGPTVLIVDIERANGTIQSLKANARVREVSTTYIE